MATTLPKEVIQLARTIDYTAKHPLQNNWTLWFDNPRKKANAQSWADNLKEVVSFDTVEEFWSTINNVSKINHLVPNANYHLFKQGVRPEWEDPANAEGGKFTIQFPKSKAGGDAINEYWTYLLLAVIGEQLATEEEICGAVASVRKQYYRLTLWVKTSNDEEKIEKIRQEVRNTLNLDEEIPIEFAAHSDVAAKIASALAATTLEETSEAAASTEEATPAKTDA